MSRGAIEALRADRRVLLEICGGLSEAQWKSPSGCPGWSVQDLVTHMGTLFWAVVDPAALPDTGDLATEASQEVRVAARRDWSPDRVLDDYETVSVDAIDQLAELEQHDMVLPLGDLGTYPVSLLSNAFSFDHYTHIRADLFPPRGCLDGPPPAADPLRLGPALDWIEAALPQQSPAAVDALPGAVDLHVTGTVGRTIRVGTGDVVGEVTSDAEAFVLWVTQRGSWEDLGVVATGDDEALRLARQFKVF